MYEVFSMELSLLKNSESTKQYLMSRDGLKLLAMSVRF